MIVERSKHVLCQTESSCSFFSKIVVCLLLSRPFGFFLNLTLIFLKRLKQRFSGCLKVVQLAYGELTADDDLIEREECETDMQHSRPKRSRRMAATAGDFLFC